MPRPGTVPLLLIVVSLVPAASATHETDCTPARDPAGIAVGYHYLVARAAGLPMTLQVWEERNGEPGLQTKAQCGVAADRFSAALCLGRPSVSPDGDLCPGPILP